MVNLAILISGSGSTAAAILQAHTDGQLEGVQPVVVISSNPQAAGIAKAQHFNIPTVVIDPRTFTHADEFGKEILTICVKYSADFISQNGWLPKTPQIVIEQFENRIINQHPGPLDPGHHHDFGGKGMYGARVTAARLAYIWASGCRSWTESTLHHVTSDFDRGDLISVVEMPVWKPGTPIEIKNLEEKIELLIEKTKLTQQSLLPLEHANVISVLSHIGRGEIPFFKRKEQLISVDTETILENAKKIAIKVFPNG